MTIFAPKRQAFAIRKRFNGRQHITDPYSLHNTLVDCMTLLHSLTRRHMIKCYSESLCNLFFTYIFHSCMWTSSNHVPCIVIIYMYLSSSCCLLCKTELLKKKKVGIPSLWNWDCALCLFVFKCNVSFVKNLYDK